MVEANFISVFVGIESPNEASLRETKKFQNLRKGGTLVDRIHTIQAAGLEVWCGMILGFDHDDPSIFDAQCEFLRLARVPHASIGMLSAIPKTPLYARLARAGRLDPDDVPAYGTNVIPLRMTREELRAGFVKVMNELYDPQAFFERLEDLFLRHGIPFTAARVRTLPWYSLRRLRIGATDLVSAVVLMLRLLRASPESRLRREYVRRLFRFIRHRRDPGLLLIFAIKCAMHYHHHTMAREMATGRGPIVNIF